MFNLVEKRKAPDSFADMLDCCFGPYFNQEKYSLQNITGSYKVDIKEDKNSFTIIMDVPGMTKDDISIKLEKNNILTVSGERKSEETKEEESYLWLGRTSSSFRRQFNIENVNSAEIKAKCNNGVLEIFLPKKEIIAEEEEKTIEIE